MDLGTALAIFGAIIALLQTAEMVYKYGPPIFNKIKSSHPKQIQNTFKKMISAGSRPFFKKGVPTTTCNTCDLLLVCGSHSLTLKKI